MSAAKKKGRPCPAVGGTISPAECGEGRNSRYVCPDECPFNPFARHNYDQVLEMETGVDNKCLAWMFGESPGGANLQSEFRRKTSKALPNEIHGFVASNLFYARDAAGRTCAQRIEAAGFPGMKNDERALLGAKMQMRVALLEVQQVIDHERLEAVDLLEKDPRPSLFLDRNLAARAGRFTTILTWIFPMPHFWRVSGAATTLPEMGAFDAKEVVTEILRHLDAPMESEALREWLGMNVARVEAAIDAVARERRRQMFASIDAQIGRAVYELRAPFAECRTLLDAEDEIERSVVEQEERDEGFAEARDWFDDSEETAKSAIAPGRQSLGRVLLGQTFWRLEAISAARMARLRERFEAVLGQRVQFSRERRDDLGAQMAAKEPVVDISLIPPRLLEQPRQAVLSSTRVDLPDPGMPLEEASARLKQDFYRDYMDRPLPGLDGRTPREASADPVLRPRLIKLMKVQIESLDRENLRTGRTDDINWLVRELGLGEIDFPPPPKRARLVDTPDEDVDDLSEEDLEDEFDDDDFEDLPFAMLPDEPLSYDEAYERLENSHKSFASAAAALDALEDSGSDFIDVVTEATEGLFDDEGLACLVTFLLNIWFALVPPGTRGPDLDPEELRELMERDFRRFEAAGETGANAVVEAFVGNVRQPALTEVVLSGFDRAMKKLPKKQRPSDFTQALISVVLKAVIEEIDRGIRE